MKYQQEAMPNKRFERLVKRRLLAPEEQEEIVRVSGDAGCYPEELLIRKGIPKYEMLLCLSEYYGAPFVEYDEGITVSRSVLRQVDAERLKQALWFPLSVARDKAEVIAYNPEDPSVIQDIRKTLGVDQITFLVALPSDLVRIIEHNQDINPHFPPSAGRTPLATTRTFLADRRSLFACDRTFFAKGRTGLAFFRTGISFISIAIVLFRIFGIGYFSLIEGLLVIAGTIMAADGLRWYIPARKEGNRSHSCSTTQPTCGTTVLAVMNPGDDPAFVRSEYIKDSEKLRGEWGSLSPVMRRRFLASDRTDLAEERTVLACYRTRMARARTGLGFTRTGIAFIGLGIALLRQFHTSWWSVFDALIILTGLVMALEGFYWYLKGRRAGVTGYESALRESQKAGIWDLMFPPAHHQTRTGSSSSCPLPVRPSHLPGIWGTTGLALERTLLAERRNVMARLRTVMARSRTGLSFIRTGMSMSAVGGGLLVYFGNGSSAWTSFEAAMVLMGLAVILDGLYWYIPAEKIRRQFPYCFGEMEFKMPDYGTPVRRWRKVIFGHDAL
jgi:uncharacterized membrane protein YidH (DUF202 family)